MTQTQINAFLLGLFGMTGPVAKLLASVFHLDGETIHSILDICTLLTPAISGAIWTYLQRPTGVIKTAEKQDAVATVVIKDEANGAIAQMARDDENHPNIVTETQNEADAKKGTKTP